MTETRPVELPHHPIAFVLGWICACSPFIVLFVVFTALAGQAPGVTGSFAVIEHVRRALMRPVLQVGWIASMMFAAYLAGPIWLTLLCVPRCRFSSKMHAIQGATLVIGWLLIWLLLIRRDDIISRIP